jgi:hypothetical protein
VGSGLIYAVIIGAWVIVGVQYLARRHDEISETRSVDRFSHAMRILSRRQPKGAPDRRYVVMPRRDQVAEVVVSGRPARRPATASAPVRAASAPSAAAARRTASGAKRRPSLVARRRRLFLGLLMLTVTVTVTVAAGFLPQWAIAVGAAFLVTFVVHLRLQARRASAPARPRVQQRPHRPAASRRLAAEALPAERRSAPQKAAPARLPEPAHPTTHPAAAPMAEEADDDGWAPMPVHVPTYVNKPKAPRTARTIDLTRPGAWSSGQGVEQGPVEEVQVQEGPEEGVPSEAVATSALSTDEVYDDAAYDAELDAIIERRWAVND